MNVHLILIDGMRPDALEKCSNPYIKKLLSESYYTLSAKTVFPSVTLPCHMSLFHSVDPERHGITTNFFMPQVRPIMGLFEAISPFKTTAMFYNWDQLRDLARPDGLSCSAYISQGKIGYEKSNRAVCDAAVTCVKNLAPDFCFTYLGWVDEQGHKTGWMGEEYLHSLDESFKCVEEIINAMNKEDIVIVVADHGGHDRAHGTTMDEDMIIPVIIHGGNLPAGIIEKPVSIKDIAPTITKLLGCPSPTEWEGTSIL